jgi:cell division protein FtsL
MVKEDSIMEDHSKHPCKQQRMEQERMKNRIKQTTTAFLTTIIVTLIILNTGSRNRNTTTWTVRTETGQQGRKRRQ